MATNVTNHFIETDHLFSHAKDLTGFVWELYWSFIIALHYFESWKVILPNQHFSTINFLYSIPIHRLSDCPLPKILLWFASRKSFKSDGKCFLFRVKSSFYTSDIYIFQKQPSRGVLRKMCSKNMRKIYRRTIMPKCDFSKITKQLYWNPTSAWVLSSKSAAYFENSFS